MKGEQKPLMLKKSGGEKSGRKRGTRIGGQEVGEYSVGCREKGRVATEMNFKEICV